jgi:hypothetical protein
MKRISTIVVVVVTAALLSLGGGVTARAQTLAIAPIATASSASGADGSAADSGAADNCSLSVADFAQLQNTQTLAGELALRKQLLGQTIACAISDAQSLQQTLNAISMPDSESASIQNQLSGRLDDAVNFYNLESAKLNGAGVSATEAIAQEITSWRTANYDSLTGQINNLILWSQNQGLFQTAETRLTQTTQIVNFIEAAAANNNLQGQLNDAASSLETAESENAAAEAALAQFQSPDQSLGLIQQSLQSLADTYQQFSSLNMSIQALLPTGQ